jgi:hypothetical protein
MEICNLRRRVEDLHHLGRMGEGGGAIILSCMQVKIMCCENALSSANYNYKVPQANFFTINNFFSGILLLYYENLFLVRKEVYFT